MSIMLMGGPSASYITNLIKNNSRLFAGSLSMIIRNNLNSYWSQAISNLISNNREMFSQAITTIIEENVNNYFSQSIANLIENYHNHFEGALAPALNGFGPVSFTDFSDTTYWVPVKNTKWNITWPGGGSAGLSTNVTAQDDLYQRTLCGFRFRAAIFPDENTKQATVTLRITNISNGNPTSVYYSHRHLLGIAVTAYNKLVIGGVGRNGDTLSYVTASSCTNSTVSSGIGLSSGGIKTTNLTGSTWEVRMVYSWDMLNKGMRVLFRARVDGGSWIDVLTGERYFSVAQLGGLRLGVVGCAVNSIYPDFGGRLTEFTIDEGRYISL